GRLRSLRRHRRERVPDPPRRRGRRVRHRRYRERTRSTQRDEVGSDRPARAAPHVARTTDASRTRGRITSRGDAPRAVDRTTRPDATTPGRTPWQIPALGSATAAGRTAVVAG